MILPAENKMNVEEDLTPEQLENLTIHYVKTIGEALRVSLPAVAESLAAKSVLTPPKEIQARGSDNPTYPGAGDGSGQGRELAFVIWLECASVALTPTV